jgi:hypothetical protein
LSKFRPGSWPYGNSCVGQERIRLRKIFEERAAARRSEQSGSCVIPECVRVAHVATQRVDRLVPAHVHHLEQRGPAGSCGGKEARAEAMPRKRISIEPQARRIALHDQGHALRREPIRQYLAAFAHPTKQRPVGDGGGGEPVHHRRDRASDRAAADRDNGAGALLIGLGPTDGDAEPFWAFREVGDVERDELGPASGQGEAEQQQGAIAPADASALATGDHGEHLVGGRGDLLNRLHAQRSARAAHDGLDPLVLGRRWQPGQLVGMADPGDPAPKGRAFDAATGFGRNEGRNGGGVGRERTQTLLGAPCPEDREVAPIGALSRSRLLRSQARGRRPGLRPNGDPVLNFSDLTREQAAVLHEVTVDTYVEGRGDDAREVKRVRFKLCDKLGALRDLGRHHKLFTDKTEFEVGKTLEQLITESYGAAQK